MAVKITIPVEFKDTAQSYKQIIASLEKQLKTVKPGTAIYDNLSEQLKKAKKMMERLDLSFDAGISSYTDVDKIERSFASLARIIEEVRGGISSLDFSGFNVNLDNFGQLYTDLVNATKKLQEAQDKLNKSREYSARQVLSSEDGQVLPGFTDDQLSKNSLNLLDELNASLNETNSKLETAKQNTKEFQDQLAKLEEEKSQSGYKIDQDAEKIIEIAKLGSVSKVKESLYKEIKNNSFDSDGKLQTDKAEAIKTLLSAFGIGEESISAALEQGKDNLAELRNLIGIALTETGEIDVEKTSKSRTSINGTNIGKAKKDYQQKAADSKALRTIDSKIADITGSVTNAQVEENTQAQAYQEILSQVEALKAALVKAGVLGENSNSGSLEKDVEVLEAEVEEIKSKIQTKGRAGGGGEPPEPPNRRGADDALDAAKEAERFRDNLKNSISHWLSAQMIITKVREGIHQAWVDIQGLDKAMTNIAVVTDMSVSDLWGKIDEYMSIAQEYGVTTQGVYEVSQLYYQQGLATNEVMKATTETLKMARIAGMDYKDAADAMTVAIRAFKMEMSDAQVITDVYSKVAAVTASDSQELAIAMSKTASSAESVGSSFENTTAMLAVMIETTRESAQNLGSALKSIISRYGEMKTGLTVDSEGEAIDYNKVDTALQSVGISIKDAQGQFRDFDDVIFELSKKWDSLDKNTQRYIATIMAGNRQQSRFIALVDNWERLEEVSAAAYDSEDAGLLQYAKTLDSLETKLNALSTSFQQFYMSIINGDTFKGAIDLITQLLNGLNKIGSWTSIFNIALLAQSLKTVGTLLVNGFSEPMSKVVSVYKQRFDEITNLAFIKGREAGEAHYRGFLTASDKTIPNTAPVQSPTTILPSTKIDWSQGIGKGLINWIKSNPAKFSLGASAVGSLATIAGTKAAENNQRAGSLLSMLGSTASGASMGMSIGGPWGALIGGIAGALANLPAVVDSFELDTILQEKIDKAKEVFDDAEIVRATKKEEARNLAATIDNLKKLQQARYSSEEAEKAFIEASNAAFEQFPQLTATFDETGNAIIDVISKSSNAEYLLMKARQQSANATLDAAEKEGYLRTQEEEQSKNEYARFYTTDVASRQFYDALYGNLSFADREVISFDANKYRDTNVYSMIKGYIEEVYQAYGTEDIRSINLINALKKDLKNRYNVDLTNSADIWSDFEGIIAEARRAWTIDQDQIASNNASIISGYLTQLDYEIDPTQSETWRTLQGVNEYFEEYIIDKVTTAEELFTIDEKNGKKILNEQGKTAVQEAYNNFTEQIAETQTYLKENLQTDEYEKAIKDIQSKRVSPKLIQENLNKIFNNQIPEVIQQYLDSYSKEMEEQASYIAQYAMANLPTLFEWTDEKSLTEIFTNQAGYSSGISNVIKNVGNLVDSGTIDALSGQEWIKAYIDIFDFIDTNTSLTEKQIHEVKAILTDDSTDLFSISGLFDIATALKEINIDPESIGLNNLYALSNNFNTEFASLSEKTGKGLESLTKILKNAADGLDTETASNLAKQLNTTLNDTSKFEFIDGKWFVKNIKDIEFAVEKMYAGLRSNLEASLEEARAILFSTDENDAIKKQSLIDSNFDNAMQWGLAQGASAEVLRNLPKETLVEIYLTKQYEGIVAAYDQEKEWLLEQAAYNSDIASRTRDLLGGEEAQRTRESWDIIKNTGLKGYKASDVAKIEKDLGLSPEAFIDNGDGTWQLDQTKLNDIPIDVRNTILASIDNETESAIKAIESIGSEMVGEEKSGIYAEAFSQYAAKYGYETAETVIPDIIKAAVNGDTGSQTNLKQLIANELTARGETITGVDDPKVVKAYNELIAGYKDGVNNNITRLLELSQKSIKGTLTEAEAIELKDLQLDNKEYAETLKKIISDETLKIAEKASTLVIAAVQAYLNGDASWEEAETTLEETYSGMLGRNRKKQAGINENAEHVSFEDLEEIVSSGGVYSEQAMSALLSMAGGEGITVTEDTLNEVIKWDEVKKGWVFAAGKGLEDLLGTEIPEYIEEAVDTSENIKDLNNKVNAENTANTIIESFTNLYTNAEKATLEDIKSLYDSVYGEHAFANSGTSSQWEAAIKAAKDGNEELLRSHLDALIQDAKSKGKIVDADSIQREARNLVSAAIESEIKQATESISSLGAASAASRGGDDRGIYADAFDELSAMLGRDYVDQKVKNNIALAAAGGEAGEAARKALLADIGGNLVKKGENITDIEDPRVVRLYNLLIAGYKDGITSNTLRYLELAQKQAEGTITETEKQEMTDLVPQSEAWVVNLVNTLAEGGSDSLSNLALIISNALANGINWSEIEDEVQSQAEGLFNTEKLKSVGIDPGDSVGKGKLLNSIVDSAGVYGEELYTNLYNYAAENGLDFNEELFKQAFNYSSIAGGFVATSSEAVQQMFAGWGEGFVKAFTLGSNSFNAEEVIRFDDLGTSVTETISGFYSNIAEISLGDLADLYESIHGPDTFAQSGLVDDYQIAIREAKKGNVDILSDFTNDLIKEVKAKGIEVDTTAIQNAMQDFVLARMASIVQAVEAGIGGTMTNTDYTELLKRIGVNQFEPDGSISKDWERWQGMVYSTNEGLQFTKQGILDIYGVVSNRNAMAAQGILEMVAEDYREYDNLSSTLAHIRELRDLRDKADPTKRKQYEQELEVAEKIAKLRSQDPDSFNFMERAIPDEIQSPLNVWQNAADAASALQDAKKNGYMGAEDFYRIVTTASEYMTAAGQEFSVAGMTYEDLISKATSSLATANGNLVVDFSKFGVDFAGGIDDMAGGLEKGLKALAEEQIKMLDGLIAMLETLKTIEELKLDQDGNGIDLGEIFTITDTGDISEFTDTFIEWWNRLQTAVGEIRFDNGKFNLGEALARGIVTPNLLQDCSNEIQRLLASENIDPYTIDTQIQDIVRKYFGEGVTFGIPFNTQLSINSDGTFALNGEGKYPTREAALEAYCRSISPGAWTFTEDGIVHTVKFEQYAKANTTVRIDESSIGTSYTLGSKTFTDRASFLAALTSGSDEKDAAKVNETVVTADGEKYTVKYNEKLKINYLVAEDDTSNFLINGESTGYASIDEYVTAQLEAQQNADGEGTSYDVTTTLGIDASQADGELKRVNEELDTLGKKTTRPKVSISDNTKSGIDAINAKLLALTRTRYVDVVVREKTETTPEVYGPVQQQSSPPSGGSTNSGRWIDKIMVKGNVALAKGTLMGELGPELYVQNGSYHIAGSNGPEFVDLADDAIVFNHLQTKRILNTGHSFGHGTPVTNERRAVAWATGNVTGPALAGGIDSAIEQLKTAREFWKGLLNQLSLSELMSGSGGHKGGGSGNSIKAVTEELQEWYNLSRQIADIEQDINNLLAERENIEWSNGEEYLKSLREQQKLLQQQMATQKALLDYQELQLKRQADHINQNRIWSQFLTVGADGLLQYIEGNETNGGKGALQVLQELNQMSAEQQTAYLKSIGYSYTDNDGNKLEGTELIEKFFEEMQAQIDQYDSLYDTVHQTEGILEDLQKDIQAISDQIKENQMELEQAVFDIIVEAWEKEIEQMQEQADLIKEANDAYINGLNEALSAERRMYDDNQKTADREQLQRQLSLLRRSGGSASEIANLEEQLNDMLKDEYFNNQERMIEDIQQANDIQVQQLETQIRLQEEALEFQKEHGVIWQQVYEVLSKSREEILAFMQGNSTEFFSKSLLQQEQMLTEWAHKIGIYKEDQKYQNYVNHAQTNLWENGQAWNLGSMSSYQSTYNGLTDEEKNTIRDQFTSVYAQARLDGKDHTTAANEAAAAVSQTLKRKQDANNSQNNQAPTTNPNPQNPGEGDNGGSSSDSTSGSSSNENPNEMTHWKFTYNGKTYKHYKSQDSAISKMQALGREYLAANPGSMSKVREMFEAAKKTLKSGKHYAQGYSEGGLVDYTGVAIVHGSKTKPEGFLNAEQTAQIREGLKESGKGGALEGIKAALLKLDSSIKAVTNISNKSESNSYTIAPGAVVIQVEQLNDAYDVDTLSADIMNRMYAIGNKSTNRGVSRR